MGPFFPCPARSPGHSHTREKREGACIMRGSTAPCTCLLRVAVVICAIAMHVIATTCPDGGHCPFTCCQDTGGGYACCDFVSANCCSDRIHCCPSEYSCSDDDGYMQCVMSSGVDAG